MNTDFDINTLRSPRDAAFELTVRCNLSCKMCLFRHSSCEQADIISKELSAEQWIKIANEAAQMGVVGLLISGGEPMLRPDFAEIYRKIYRLGFLLELYTNATLITPEIKELLTEFPPHKIGVTLYGADEETYKRVCGSGSAFNKAIEGIKFLCTLPSVIDFRTTIINENLDSVSKMEDLIQKEFGNYTLTHTRMVIKSVRGGCADVQNCRLSPQDNVDLTVTRLLKPIEKKYGKSIDLSTVKFSNLITEKDCNADNSPHVSLIGCEGGMKSFCVTWDGKLQACQVLGAFQTSVTEKGLKNAWDNFPKVINYNISDSDCTNCKYANLCQTCPASRYAETGSISGCPDYAKQDAQRMSKYYKENI